MKTERRHELQSNTLVQLLSHYHSVVKPYLGWIAGALAFLLVVWLAVTWLGFSRQRQLRAGWSDYVYAYKALDVDGLRQVAARFPRSPAAARALYTAGNIGLHLGTNRLLVDRADGLEQLDQARRDLEAALASPYQDPFVTPQAQLLLAQVFEAVNELDQAKEQYQRVLDRFPGSSYAVTAKRRLDFVNTADAVAFSDWFAKQRIELPTSASTSGWTPPKSSPHDDLPVSRDLLLPSADALERSIYDSDLGLMIPPVEGEPAPPVEDETVVPVDEMPNASEPSNEEAPPVPDGSGAPDESSAHSNDDEPTSG